MHFVNARLSCVLNGALDLNLPEAITRVSVFLFSCNALTHSPTVSPLLPFLLPLLPPLHPPKQHSKAAVLFLILTSLIFTVSTRTACFYVFKRTGGRWFRHSTRWWHLGVFSRPSCSLSFNTVHCQTFYRLKHQCNPFAVPLLQCQCVCSMCEYSVT